MTNSFLDGLKEKYQTKRDEECTQVYRSTWYGIFDWLWKLVMILTFPAKFYKELFFQTIYPKFWMACLLLLK